MIWAPRSVRAALLERVRELTPEPDRWALGLFHQLDRDYLRRMLKEALR